MKNIFNSNIKVKLSIFDRAKPYEVPAVLQTLAMLHGSPAKHTPAACRVIRQQQQQKK